MKTIPSLVLALLLTSLAALRAADSKPTEPSRDDASWLREKGKLIFHDAFEREEDGNLAKAIGNSWNSATADRVPQIKITNKLSIPTTIETDSARPRMVRYHVAAHNEPQ